MSKKIKFSRLAQIREYAEQRAGGDKPFNQKNSQEKAYSTLESLAQNYEAEALEKLHADMESYAKLSDTTKAKIYSFVAERIGADE